MAAFDPPLGRRLGAMAFRSISITAASLNVGVPGSGPCQF
jgi:hypothetical protein